MQILPIQPCGGQVDGVCSLAWRANPLVSCFIRWRSFLVGVSLFLFDTQTFFGWRFVAGFGALAVFFAAVSATTTARRFFDGAVGDAWRERGIAGKFGPIAHNDLTIMNAITAS